MQAVATTETLAESLEPECDAGSIMQGTSHPWDRVALVSCREGAEGPVRGKPHVGRLMQAYCR